MTELRRSVGAFDVSILSGSSAAVEGGSSATSFSPTTEAPKIVDEYASRGYVFAAIRLSAGAGLDELHPLVVKYRGSEPCVPLKLTAIAAKEDMAVRAFFLGQRRAVPIGDYRHVSLNFARLDWRQYVTDSNYTTLVSNAVDSAGADGHAFVTEFAGPSSIVPGRAARTPMERVRLHHARGGRRRGRARAPKPDELSRGERVRGAPPASFPAVAQSPAAAERGQRAAILGLRACASRIASIPRPFDGAAFARDFDGSDRKTRRTRRCAAREVELRHAAVHHDFTQRDDRGSRLRRAAGKSRPGRRVEQPDRHRSHDLRRQDRARLRGRT